jgi:hypothetical protein
MVKNPFQIVSDFEQEMADFTGAPYAVAVDSCTAALHLCLLWEMRKQLEREKARGHHTMPAIPVLEIPERTFISVPTVAAQAGFSFTFHSREWKGWYRLDPLPIWDSALRLRRDMWHDCGESDNTQVGGKNPPIRFICLSFQYRKHLPIGRGGMILHNDPDAHYWFQRMRFYGRDPVPLENDSGPHELGYRYYMTPDEAARGLCFLHRYAEDHDGSDLEIDYPGLANVPAFQPHILQGGTDEARDHGDPRTDDRSGA